jgi:hypothetical protein
MYFCSILHKRWIIHSIIRGLKLKKDKTRHQRDLISIHNTCREYHGNHITLIWLLPVNNIFLMWCRAGCDYTGCEGYKRNPHVYATVTCIRCSWWWLVVVRRLTALKRGSFQTLSKSNAKCDYLRDILIRHLIQ